MRPLRIDGDQARQTSSRLLAAWERQRRDLKQLQNSVQTCLANYYGLLQQLESAEARGTA